MNYTNFNMRLDNDLRGRAYPVLEQYGLTPSQAVRMFFNQIAETGKVPLSFDWAGDVLTAKAIARLERTEIEFADGEFDRFESLEDLNKAMAEIARD